MLKVVKVVGDLTSSESESTLPGRWKLELAPPSGEWLTYSGPGMGDGWWVARLVVTGLP